MYMPNCRSIKNLPIKISFGIDYGNYNKRMLQRSYNSGYLQNDQTNAVTHRPIGQ